MKRLYISDLDGTLLDADKKITDETSEILNQMIENGIYFTFATARTSASALKITSNLHINVPCILMNGVSIYDIHQQKYLKNEYLTEEKSAEISYLLDSYRQDGFMYKISEDKLSCEYTNLSNPHLQEFHDIRVNRYDKPFAKIDNFSIACNDEVVYFTLLDCFENLDKIREGIENIKGLKYEFYPDIYGENLWYLEIFSDKASKYHGVEFLRRKFGFDEVVAFGDNLNDLPMFNAADIRIAVQNANAKVISAADEIAASNSENGVAKWIFKNYK